MASLLIHMAVAKEINKKLRLNNKDYMLGAIAPDISKEAQESRFFSHFLSNVDDGPNMELFLNKYKDKLCNPFFIGYYVHLYTDKLWTEDFMKKLVNTNSARMLDGTVLELDAKTIKELIYNDYTNLNIQIIDEYGIDLSLFYEEVKIPDIKMDEIPINKLQLLIDKAGVIIENSRCNNKYIFDMFEIEKFVDKCVTDITNELKTLGIEVFEEETFDTVLF